MNENVNDLLKKITSYYTKLSIGFEMIAIFFIFKIPFCLRQSNESSVSKETWMWQIILFTPTYGKNFAQLKKNLCLAF